jgi:hypothetical protein
MKLNASLMKPLRLNLVLAALFYSFVPAARAFTYQDGDLLLIFRENGYNDVEYDLGGISALLNLPSGTTVPLTNWDASLLAANYGSALGHGVKVALLGVTGLSSSNRVAWLTSSQTNASASDLAPSGWQLLWSKISGVGNNAQTASEASTVEDFTAVPSSYYSYSYLASNTGQQPGLIPTLGGASSFIVEGGLPGDLPLLAVGSTTDSPKPPATVAGTFHLDGAGNLSFTAGLPATIALPPATGLSVTAGPGATVSISFNTVAGVNYRLRYTSQIGFGPGTWTIGAQSVAGTGAAATLTDNPGRATRFYVVESYQ